MSTFARDVTLSLSLVTTKVRLEPVKDSSRREATAFKLGHDCGDGKYHPINQKKWCASCDEEVLEPVKLRAVDGGYAAFTGDEVKELKESSLVSTPKKISLTQHDTTEVLRHTQPSGASYYVYADSKGNDEALAAITHYVKTHPEKTLMSIVCLRSGSEHMARLNFVNDHLVLEMLLWPDEIARPKDEEHTASEKLYALMEQVAGSMEEPFDPDSYKSTFADAISEAEKMKMPGDGRIDTSLLKKKDQKKAGSMSLEDALEAFLAGKK